MLQPEMLIGFNRDRSASGRPHDVALLDQVRFDYVLDGAPLLSDCGRKAFYTDRPTIKFFDQGQNQAPIHVVETELVDLEHIQCRVGVCDADGAIGLHLGIVAGAS